MNRIFSKSLQKRWNDPKGLIQVFTGPRQVGKTTMATHLMNPRTTVFASADLPTPPTPDFIIEKWQEAHRLPEGERTLILDEVQKITRWSEVIKGLWDEDKRLKRTMRVCLLGSSAILIEKGLSESLTGRFEINYFPHWTFAECSKVFGITLEEYAFIGGYPKAYDFLDDRQRLQEYIFNSILEPTLGRDILSLHAVDKPALLRQLFWYVSKLPARVISYEKILGHLQGRGNSATLVHYADLLAMAYILKPISKFSAKTHRTKRSIPKWILPNPGLVDPDVRSEGMTGFLFENLVGSHILNLIFGRKEYELQFWREGKWEIDFIVTRNHKPIIALEVKSGRDKKLPTQYLLNRAELSCDLKLVDSHNIKRFLEIENIEGIENF